MSDGNCTRDEVIRAARNAAGAIEAALAVFTQTTGVTVESLAILRHNEAGMRNVEYFVAIDRVSL